MCKGRVRSGAVDRRASQVAANESLFREVNERVEELAADAPTRFVCECADIECTVRLDVPLHEYEAVREHGDRFVVAPGHERPGFETVVDVRDGYLVVRKTGETGEQAREEDPRAG